MAATIDSIELAATISEAREKGKGGRGAGRGPRATDPKTRSLSALPFTSEGMERNKQALSRAEVERPNSYLIPSYVTLVV
jgi:hypothetical protein